MDQLLLLLRRRLHDCQMAEGDSIDSRDLSRLIERLLAAGAVAQERRRTV